MRKAATATVSAALLLALAPASAAQLEPPQTTPPKPSPTIAAGVRAGGVAVGGLTLPRAARRLEAALGKRLRSPLVVHVVGRRYPLSPGRLDLRLDADRTARRAYNAGRKRDPDQPDFVAPTDVPVAVRFSRARLRGFVADVGRRVYVAPRDATVDITLTRVRGRRSYGGRKLVEYRLREAIVAVLRDPQAPRTATGERRVLRPAVTYRGLAARYPTILTVDRAGFKLRLFKRLRYDRSYQIAVGAAGYDTPTGLFRINTKQVDPPWTAPNRPWAGAYAGRTIPGGAPDNPLKARWLGIASGVGIHGTSEPWSIGSRASHGCIRMRVPDVIDLFPRVPIGAPTLIR